MSRFGKKLVIVGIWAGVGIWIGMQFGGSGGTATSQIPGWNVISGAAGNGQAAANAAQIQTQPGSSADSPAKPAYVYVPVAIDSATGAYTVLPGQIQKEGTATPSAGLPQQEGTDFGQLTPGQILVPQEQKPTVDVLADKTAGLLQRASQKSIRWVVSLFASSEN